MPPQTVFPLRQSKNCVVHFTYTLCQFSFAFAHWHRFFSFRQHWIWIAHGIWFIFHLSLFRAVPALIVLNVASQLNISMNPVRGWGTWARKFCMFLSSYYFRHIIYILLFSVAVRFCYDNRQIFISTTNTQRETHIRTNQHGINKWMFSCCLLQ